jgi:hypothetical protein
MSLKDLRKIKEEFEKINALYRRTFSTKERLDLLERVKRLLTIIRGFEERRDRRRLKTIVGIGSSIGNARGLLHRRRAFGPSFRCDALSTYSIKSNK